MRAAPRAAVIAACLLVSPPLARADDPATASLTGSVRGPDGSRLPGVVITLVHAESGSMIRSVTGPAGLFLVQGLRPGSYAVEAELDGFQSGRAEAVEVAADRTVTLDIELALAALREEVEVVGAGPRDTLELSVFRELAAKDVGDAIGQTAGMTRLRKGGLASDVVLRGLHGRDLTVVIDGQRVQGACPNHMDPPAFHVDLAEVQRVEVRKGPFDVRNQGSLGGVVNIVTQRPGRGWDGLVNVAAGSYAYVNPSATASYGGATLSALAGASYRQGEAYEDGHGRLFTSVANYRPGVALPRAFAAGTAWSRLAWTPDAGHTLQVSYTRQDAGTVLYPYLQMDGIDDNADRVGLRYEIGDGPGAWNEIGAHVYFTQVDHWMTDVHRATGATAPRGWSMGTEADTDTWGARLEGRWRAVSIGSEYSRQRWSTSTLLAMRQYALQRSLADAIHEAIGVYAEGSRALGSRLALEAGVRFDWVSASVVDTGANTALFRAYHDAASTHADDLLASGKARLVWQPASGLTVAGGLGRTTRAPDQQERYFALSRMGTDWVGNPALGPVANTGVEGEVELARRGARVAVNAFLYRIDEFIAVREVARRAVAPGVMNARARSFLAVDALMRGLDATGSLPLSNRLSLSGTVSLVRGTERGSTEGDLAEIPPARLSTGLRYDDGRLALTLDAVAAARQEHVDAALGEQPTPGYLVVNGRSSLRHRGLSLVFGVNNLLDRAYYEHLSYQRDPFRTGARVFEPGRTLYVNAAFGF